MSKPATLNGADTARAPKPSARNRTDLVREYVAASARRFTGASAAMRQTLPQYVDDLSRDLGDDVYERMMRDPVVSGNLSVLVAHTLKEGISWEPAIPAPLPGQTYTGAEQRAYELAVTIRDEFAANLEKLKRPLRHTARELLRSALGLGHKLAEINWQLEGGRMSITSIKTKPRKSFGFVVDEFNNLLGIVRLAKPTATPGGNLPAA
jgi:hypothetical protein